MLETQSCLHPVPARAAAAVPQRGASLVEKPSEMELGPGRSVGPWGSARSCHAGSRRRPAAAAGQVEAPGVLARARHGAGAQVPPLALL